jgi:hypothetical protein
MALLEHYLDICQETGRKTAKDLAQFSHCPSRESNQPFPSVY